MVIGLLVLIIQCLIDIQVTDLLMQWYKPSHYFYLFLLHKAIQIIGTKSDSDISNKRLTKYIWNIKKLFSKLTSLIPMVITHESILM